MTRFLTKHPFDDDRLHEECGVFGIYGSDDAAAHAALGLHALQHRGQESAGIVTFDGSQFHVHRSLGLVGEVFADQTVMERMQGRFRDRPQPLRHYRRDDAAQRPADIRGDSHGRPFHRP